MGWIPGWDTIVGANWWSGFFFWASIGCLLLLGATEVVSHRYSERKDELAVEEQRTEKDQHDTEIARLHLETANANKATEELRRQNLELEKALSPRTFGFTGEDLGELASLGPVRWVIRAVERDEPQDLANQIGGLLGSLGSVNWQPIDPATVPFDLMGMANVTIWLSDNSPRRAAEELARVFRRSDIDTYVRNLPSNRAAALGPNAMLVEVGKTQPLVIIRAMKEAKEKWEKNAKEVLERARARGLVPSPPQPEK